MKSKVWMIISFSLIIAMIILVVGLMQKIDNLQEDETCALLKEVEILGFKKLEIAEDSEDIFYYYDKASDAYLYDEWDNVVYYCEKSRDESTRYSQKLREQKAEIVGGMIVHEKWRELYDIEIETYFALYEACEWFEDAAKLYKADDYYQGGIYIDNMNERINDYDNLVEEYSQKLAEVNKILKDLLLIE